MSGVTANQTKKRFVVQYVSHWDEWIVRDSESFDDAMDAMQRRDKLNAAEIAGLDTGEFSIAPTTINQKSEVL